MGAWMDGRPAGFASWGYGISPARTPGVLFGDAGRFDDYLELNRFYVEDWCPPNTASQFLATTHRMLRRYTDTRWLFSYAAGFQGMVGTIYQAAGYEYCGFQLAKSLTLIPDVGMVHNVSLWHRYGIGSSDGDNLAKVQAILPGSLRWRGANFRYIYWMSAADRAALIPHATFPVGLPNPKLDDLLIWTEDLDGVPVPVPVAVAKRTPIVRLPSRRAGSIEGDAPAIPGGSEGGSIPTPALDA